MLQMGQHGPEVCSCHLRVVTMSALASLFLVSSDTQTTRPLRTLYIAGFLPDLFS